LTDLLESQRVTGEETAKRQLTRIWQSVLALASIGIDDDYFDLGGDSVLAVQLFAQIERAFGVKLPLATLYEAPTIAELARILSGEVSSSGWSPLVPIQTSGSRPPLFCFHGAGGNVLSYRKLSQHLGLDQPFYGLQCRGLDGSAEPLKTIEEMAALYIEQIRRVQRRGPYFLGGYCMGGTVAYEVGQQLCAAGETIALLALFDTMNWNKIPLSVWNKTSYAVQRLVFHAASFLSLRSEDKVKFIKDKAEVLRNRIPVWRGILLTKLGRQDAAPSNSLILGRIWQTNDQASWSYIPKPFPGELTDIRPDKQYWVFNKPDLKWDRLALGGQRVVRLPVYPASMLVEPFVRHSAAALRTAIDLAICSVESGPSNKAVTCGM
jgi:phthiocerol/phenolphthiocerol synthesis type-I polyketide synthase E